MHSNGTSRWPTLVIWMVATAIAVLSCCLNISAARMEGEYIPVGHDSFYHARRILDTVAHPDEFYEFDDRIHAPEGSLLPWPWGYDYLMAGLVRAGLALGLSQQPIEILLWIPVSAVALSIGLLLLIGRRVGLSNWPLALAALCMALSPTTQLLHGFGEIDHHFAEFICILAALAAGLAWVQQPAAASSIVLGATFGLSLAIHNGLFILQAPFLATLSLRWLLGHGPPRRPTVILVISLLLTTLAVLIPSVPFHQARFEFFTLSWFHLYTAAGTAITSLLLAWLKPTRRNVVGMVVLAVLLLLPLAHEIQMAQSFLRGTLGILDSIQEMRSPIKLASENGLRFVTLFYSFLIWFAPLTLMLCIAQCWREHDSPRLLFWIASAMGLLLLFMQMRLHYFGAFALYLPWLVLLSDYALARPEIRKRTYLLATLALLLTYVPQIRHALLAPVPRGGDVWLGRLYPIFPAMREACAKDPGIVLADSTAGHYIRYFTECSVIANNFLLTQQHFDKVFEVWRLSSLSPQQLLEQAPQVKYVLVRPANVIRHTDGKYSFSFFGNGTPQLQAALLFGPDELPPQFRLIDEVRFGLQLENFESFPYARLFRIERDSASTQSANEVSN